MKLSKKVFSLLTATIFALSLMVSTALASEPLFTYPEDAGVATNNDVWVFFYHSSNDETLVDPADEDARDSVAKAIVYISGEATFDAELIYNSEYVEWDSTPMPGQSVDGEMTLERPIDGKGMSYVELIVNLQNKSEGPLAVDKIEFVNGDGEVIVTAGGSAAASDDAADDGGDAGKAPAEGVASSALFLGLGALALGTGAVVLKKKEEK